MIEKRFTDVWCSETGHIGFTDNGIDKELTGTEFEEFLNNLNDENKQLKQQLYCDSDDGVCSICVNHYLVRGKTYNKYYISKCKKGHEECSTEILKHCKHFKMRDGGDD